MRIPDFFFFKHAILHPLYLGTANKSSFILIYITLYSRTMLCYIDVIET